MTQQDLQGIADTIAPGSRVRDPQTFAQFLAEQAANYSAQTGEPPENALLSLFNRTVGRGIGAVGRGTLGAGRFLNENAVQPLEQDLARRIAPAIPNLDPNQPGLDPQQRQAIRTLRSIGTAADQYSAATGSAVAQQFAPLLSAQQGIGSVTQLGRLEQGLPPQPNSFDAFIADLQQRRQGQSVLDALTLRSDREAFRQSDIPAKFAFEAAGDVTNLIPGEVVARGLGLAVREAAERAALTAGRAGLEAELLAARQAERAATQKLAQQGLSAAERALAERQAQVAAGQLRALEREAQAASSISQAGSRAVPNAAERGTAAAARSLARDLRAPAVTPFGPNRTTEGVPGGIPAGAADVTHEQEPFFSYSATQAQRAEHEDLYRRFLAGEKGFETVDKGNFTVVQHEGKPVFDLMSKTAPPGRTPEVELETEIAAVRNRLSQAGIPPRPAPQAPSIERPPLTPEQQLEQEVAAARGPVESAAEPALPFAEFNDDDLRVLLRNAEDTGDRGEVQRVSQELERRSLEGGSQDEPVAFDRIAEIDAQIESQRDVVRPPWAAGLTNQELRAVARQEGVDPTQTDWYDGLDPVVIGEAKRRYYRDVNVPSLTQLRSERSQLRRSLRDVAAQRRAESVLDPAAQLEAEIARARAGQLKGRPRVKVGPEQFAGAVDSEGRVTLPEAGIRLFGVRAPDLGLSRGQIVLNRVRNALPGRVTEAPVIRRVLGTDRDPLIDNLFRVCSDMIENAQNRSRAVTGRIGPLYRRLFSPDSKGRILSLDGIDPALPGAPTLQDVAARLPLYRPLLSDRQVRFLDDLRAELAPYERLLRAVGDDFGQRTDIMEGGFYIPRGSAVTGDAPNLPTGLRARPGATPGFERPAGFESQAEGIARGFEYPTFDGAVAGYIQRAGRRTADQFTQNYLATVRDASGQKFGLTAKELLMRRSPQIAQRMDGLRVLRDRLSALLEGRENAMEKAISQFLDDPEAVDIDDAIKAFSRTQAVRRGRLKGVEVDQLRQTIRQTRQELRELKPVYDRALRTVQRGRLPIGGPGEFPQLNGVTFPERMAARANQVLEREREEFPEGLRLINEAQQIFKGMEATLDNSGVGIQGLLSAYNNPRAFQRAMRANIKAFGTERAYADWAEGFNRGSQRRGLLTVEQWTDNGLAQIQRDPDVVSPLTERIPVAGRVFAGTNRAFSVISDVVRAEWANDLLMEELAKGRTVDDVINSGDIRRITDFVNAATGYRRGRFSVANLVTFSARFLSSRFVTLGRAVRGLDIDAPFDVVPILGPRISRQLPKANPVARREDKLARRAVLRMIGFGTMMTVALNEIQGRDTDFRPIVDGRPNPNFMRFRFANRDWSLFGPWDSLARIITGVGTGQFKSTARGVGNAPFVALGWDLLENKDFFGNPIFRPEPTKAEKRSGAKSPTGLQHTQDLLARMAETTIPFAEDEAPQIIRDIGRGARDGHLKEIGLQSALWVAEGLGVKSSPLSTVEIETLLGQPGLDPELRAELEAELAERKAGRRQGSFQRLTLRQPKPLSAVVPATLP